MLPLIYAELREAAARAMSRERPSHTLQPTALVHEAFFKLIDARGVTFQDRHHFLKVAARAMRQVLVDHARAKQTHKRRGVRSEEALDQLAALYQGPSWEVLSLHEGLERLAEADEELARIVELRFFGGLSVKEVAEILGVSHRRIERAWSLARAWLRRYLGSDMEAPSP